VKRLSFYIISIVVIGALSSSYWAYQKYFSTEKENFLFFHVERGDIREVVKVRGEVVAQQEFDLEFPFSETVEKIYVKEGQSVKSGDKLMKLDTANFLLEISEIKGQMAQAWAGVRSAKAQVARYRADVDSAKDVLNQYEAALDAQVKKLIDIENGARDSEIKVAKTAVENARTSLDDVENELKNVTDKVESDVESLLQISNEVVSEVFVSVDKIFTGNLESVIYLLRTVPSRTCSSSVIDEGSMVVVKDTCFSLLTSYENLKSSVQLNKGEDIETVLLQLNQQKVFVSSLRSFLSQLLGNLNEGTEVSYRNLITGSQIEVESVASKITAQIEKINLLKKTNKSVVDLAKNKVNTAKNVLATAQDQLALLEAGPTIEQVDAQKAEVVSARARIESQKSQIKKTEALVKAQQAQVSNSQANSSVIKARLGKVQEKIKKSTIFAPADSRVVKILLEEHEVFRPGSPAISLSSDSYKVLADVSELDIGRVKSAADTNVEIELDAFEGEKFKGKILSIDPKEISKNGDRFYQVNASLLGKKDGVRSGMSVDLYIIISSKKSILKIPEIAVSDDNGRDFVTVLDGDEKKEVNVNLGISDDEYVEVLDGLKEGQTIVVSAD